MTTILLPLDSIETDAGTQMRLGMSAQTANEYAEILEELPAITVFRLTASSFWPTDSTAWPHIASAVTTQSLARSGRERLTTPSSLLVVRTRLTDFAEPMTTNGRQ